MDKEILQKLERLADTLEEKGLVKHAMDLDLASRSIVARNLDNMSRSITAMGIDDQLKKSLKGQKLLSDQAAAQVLQKMTPEEFDAAVNALDKPESVKALVNNNNRTAADNALLTNMRAIGSLLKGLQEKIIVFSAVLAPLGVVATDVVLSMVPEGLTSPGGILGIISGINKVGKLFIQSLKDDNKIDAAEARALSALIVPLFAKFRIRLDPHKVEAALTRVQFTLDLVSSAEEAFGTLPAGVI